MATNESTESVETLLSRAVEVWKESQLLNLSPTWNQRPKGIYLAEIIGARRECEGGLVTLLNHENGLVVAYSLVALEIMDSRSLESLSGKLLQRKEAITKVRGSFGIELELGQIAKEIQESWREKHSRPESKD
jgi:hypothetical protein